MDVKGIRVHYFNEGQGDTVLFLHGWGSEFGSFKQFLDALSPYYRVCALDLPGFGETGEPPEGWSVDDYADFVLAFMEQLSIKKVILIGHSFGGRIIIKLASRKDLPIKIEKIILVNSAGIRRKRTARQKVKQCFYKAVKQLISLEYIRRKFPEALDQWRRKNSSPDYLNASPRMRECFIKAVNEDLTPLLPQISCPTLIIWGDADLETPLEDGKTMERLIPDAGLVTLKNAGHYSFLDQSFTFSRVLDSFLNITRAS
jgi:pimeloyl-ACP methyl ester carboxylesterase